MARISNYDQDTNVKKSDKLLGSDTGGSTRNFSLASISDFFKNTNAAGVAAQFVWQYKTTSLGSGDMQITGTTFANLSSIKVNKYAFGGTESLENILVVLASKDVIIVDVDNQNNFGVYTAGTPTQDGNTDFYDIALSSVQNSNGSLTNEKFYAIMAYGGGSDKTYTHLQNNAATTWTVNHNLGKFPSVSLKFSSNDNIYTNVGAFAGVAYTNENTIIITLAAAESGYAYLN